MILVDEQIPVGEAPSQFGHKEVLIKRCRDVHAQYEMLHEIGRGKFGRVMKCRNRDQETGQFYAAKFVLCTRREDRRNVEREVSIMNKLNDTKLLFLFDAFDNGRNEMCLITEYIGGGELFDRVIEDEFVLTEKACVAFMKQIVEGVAFIHQKHIIHLDLKPENIMCLTKTGNRIKIIDFGLARTYEPMKKLQVLFGTPEFVAPEVVAFEPISFATDMWAVGVICYVLLSGLSPFMGDTDLETMANVTIADYDYEDDVFSSISDEAKDFIDKLLVKDKEKRFTASQCLEHPWLNLTNQVVPGPDSPMTTAKQNLSCQREQKNEEQNYVFDGLSKTMTFAALDDNRKRSMERELMMELQHKRSKTPSDERINGAAPAAAASGSCSSPKPQITLDQVKQKADQIKESKRRSDVLSPSSVQLDADEAKSSLNTNTAMDEALWLAAERTLTPLWEVTHAPSLNEFRPMCVTSPSPDRSSCSLPLHVGSEVHGPSPHAPGRPPHPPPHHVSSTGRGKGRSTSPPVTLVDGVASRMPCHLSCEDDSSESCAWSTTPTSQQSIDARSDCGSIHPDDPVAAFTLPDAAAPKLSAEVAAKLGLHEHVRMSDATRCGPSPPPPPPPPPLDPITRQGLVHIRQELNELKKELSSTKKNLELDKQPLIDIMNRLETAKVSTKTPFRMDRNLEATQAVLDDLRKTMTSSFRPLTPAASNQGEVRSQVSRVLKAANTGSVNTVKSKFEKPQNGDVTPEPIVARILNPRKKSVTPFCSRTTPLASGSATPDLSAPSPACTPTLRRRSPSPVFTGNVNRVRSRFECPTTSSLTPTSRTSRDKARVSAAAPASPAAPSGLCKVSEESMGCHRQTLPRNLKPFHSFTSMPKAGAPMASSRTAEPATLPTSTAWPSVVMTLSPPPAARASRIPLLSDRQLSAPAQGSGCRPLGPATTSMKSLSSPQVKVEHKIKGPFGYTNL